MSGFIFAIASCIMFFALGFGSGWSSFSSYIEGACQNTDYMIVKKKDFAELRFSCEVVKKENK